MSRIKSKWENLYYFYDLADAIKALINPNERFACSFVGEKTVYVQMNHGKTKLPSYVSQAELSISLSIDARSISLTLPVSFSGRIDKRRIKDAIVEARKTVADFRRASSLLRVPRKDHSSYHIEIDPGFDPLAVATALGRRNKGRDLCGILASGAIYRGYANHKGQKNWHESYLTTFDYSLYSKDFHHASVCGSLGSPSLKREDILEDLDRKNLDLSLMERPLQKITPGNHRVFLSPRALVELINVVSAMGGFSDYQRRSHLSPLIQLAKGKRRLNSKISIFETADSAHAPMFSDEGVFKPEKLELIRNGRMAALLRSPATRDIFGMKHHNGADSNETPVALEIDNGSLAERDVLSALDNGLYIGALWYGSVSDFLSCGINGSTRFQCFRVKNGKIRGPIPTLRFDDSLYSLLGRQLENLTVERERLFTSQGYEHRSGEHVLAPGALIKKMNFSL